MKEKTTRIGRICVFIGLLLIAAALSLSVYNVWDARRAEKRQSEILLEYQKETDDRNTVSKQEVQDYVLNPDMEMFGVTLEDPEGAACIGILEIPALS